MAALPRGQSHLYHTPGRRWFYWVPGGGAIIPRASNVPGTPTTLWHPPEPQCITYPMGFRAPWNSFRTRSTSLLTVQSFPSTANVLLPREERLCSVVAHWTAVCPSVATCQVGSLSHRMPNCVSSFSFTSQQGKARGGWTVVTTLPSRSRGSKPKPKSQKEGSRQRNIISLRVAADTQTGAQRSGQLSS